MNASTQSTPPPIAIVLCKVLAAMVLSSTAVMAVASPHKVLDLRNHSDSSGEYSVSICSRPSPGPAGLPGHAFVMYSLKPANGERRVLSLGYTTNSAVQGVLSFGGILAQPAGYLGEEKFSHAQEQCLVLMVNEGDFKAAYSAAMPFYNIPLLDNITYRGVYTLASNDCERFAIDVAKRFISRGLAIPERTVTDLPIAYVRKLIDAN